MVSAASISSTVAWQHLLFIYQKNKKCFNFSRIDLAEKPVILVSNQILFISNISLLVGLSLQLISRTEIDFCDRDAKHVMINVGIKKNNKKI